MTVPNKPEALAAVIGRVRGAKQSAARRVAGETSERDARHDSAVGAKAPVGAPPPAHRFARPRHQGRRAGVAGGGGI
jgi:hypothetical protein